MVVAVGVVEQASPKCLLHFILFHHGVLRVVRIHSQNPFLVVIYVIYGRPLMLRNRISTHMRRLVPSAMCISL